MTYNIHELNIKMKFGLGILGLCHRQLLCFFSYYIIKVAFESKLKKLLDDKFELSILNKYSTFIMLKLET